MKIAVVGAGFAGLTVAYRLSKQGYHVKVYEKNNFSGGLSSGIRRVVNDYPREWEWDLERFYHHWFTNDSAIFKLIDELGAGSEVIVPRPVTAVWTQDRHWPLDSPWSVLKFAPISLVSRLRMGVVIAYLKYLVGRKRTSVYEKKSAHQWLERFMGSEAYQSVWQPLLMGKFGDHFQEINMTWFWARIHKRTSNLAYFRGGFDGLIKRLEQEIRKYGGELLLGQDVASVEFQSQDISEELDQPVRINLKLQGSDTAEEFDYLVLTTPLPVASQLMTDLPQEYRKKLDLGSTLSALVMILLLDKPFMDPVYWLNICETGWPFIAVVEHTNFIDPAHYGGRHLVYVGGYYSNEDPVLNLSSEALIDRFAPYLRQINSGFSETELKSSVKWVFKEKFAQPVVGLDYAERVLPLQPLFPNVYLATMSQVYPWDRGTNYAVEMGYKVADNIMVSINES